MDNCLDDATKRRITRKKHGDSSIMRVLRDFTCNSSIHGIKYLARDTQESGQMAKLFWICILILAFIGSGLMVRLFWNRYAAHPTVPTIDSFYIPSFRSSFPALTVCPIIGPDPEILLRLLRGLRLSDGISEDRASFLLRNAFYISRHQSVMDEERDELNKILKLNNIHLTELLVALRSPCEHIVETCWWESKRISCVEYFKLSYTITGLCCSFNYVLEDNLNATRGAHNSTPVKSVSFGANSGLTLVFKGNQFIINDHNRTIERLTSISVGLMVFIHNGLVYPDSPSFILPVGQEMQIRISSTENQKVPGLSGENERPCFSENIKTKYFNEYWQENCYNSCRIKASLALCHCVPWDFTPFVEKSSVCGLSQMKCLRVNYQKIWSVMHLNNSIVKCSCPSRCSTPSFTVTHNEIPLAEKIFTPSPIYRNLSTENAVLKIYIGGQVNTKRIDLKIADEINLLSSLGGIFGLFLGSSILSLCEIIYFAYILIKSWIQKKMER